MARVAMIGLGRMGSGMAGRLLAAGHEVVVANRTPARADALVDAGAVLAATPAEASAGAAAAIVMVSDDEASRGVWGGPDGALAGLPSGAFAIECSTVSAPRVRELARAAGEAGLRYIDAPVTGGSRKRQQPGELTLLVGADPPTSSGRSVFLEPLAEQILHFGPVGAGNAYKLIVNLIGAVQIAGVAEGLALAERAGLDLDKVVAALALGQAASPQVVRNSRRMAASDHGENVVFSGRLRRKDAAYAMALAEELGVGCAVRQGCARRPRRPARVRSRRCERERHHRGRPPPGRARAGGSMIYQERPAPPGLESAIARLWYLEVARERPYEKILPQPAMHLIVNLSEPYRMFDRSGAATPAADAFVSGIQSEYLVIASPPVIRQVVVEVRPGGLGAISALPGTELAGRVRPAGEVVADIEALVAGLRAAASPDEALELASSALLRPGAAWRPDPLWSRRPLLALEAEPSARSATSPPTCRSRTAR